MTAEKINVADLKTVKSIVTKVLVLVSAILLAKVLLGLLVLAIVFTSVVNICPHLSNCGDSYADNLQNLINFSLYADTSLIKFSWRSDR